MRLGSFAAGWTANLCALRPTGVRSASDSLRRSSRRLLCSIIAGALAGGRVDGGLT